MVWLFGSFAHGTPTSDSDVDLLVAMDTALRNVQQAVEIRKAVAFPFPVDLLVRTPKQIAERLVLGDGFFRHVLFNPGLVRQLQRFTTIRGRGGEEHLHRSTTRRAEATSTGNTSVAHSADDRTNLPHLPQMRWNSQSTSGSTKHPASALARIGIACENCMTLPGHTDVPLL